jgi:hypothetical protein
LKNKKLNKIKDMDSIVDSEYFIIRSSQSIFNTMIDIDPERKFNRVCITSASIPKTFYVLKNDAVLSVLEGKTTTNITFRKGNYDLNSFKSVFVSEMKGCVWDYDISYPSRTQVNTNKYTYTVSGNSGQPVFRTGDKYLGGVMGLDVNTDYTFSGNELVSEKVINFQAYDEIKIMSNIAKNKSSLLQEIYSTGEPYGSSILFQQMDSLANSKILNNINGNVFEFKLLDSENSEIDLNGSEWSFCIMLFRVDNLSEVIKKFIEILITEKEKENII